MKRLVFGGVLTFVVGVHSFVSPQVFSRRNGLVHCWGLSSYEGTPNFTDISKSIVTIYSSGTKKPVASGFIFDKSGLFLTIPNFLPPTNNPEQIPRVAGQFYCQLLGNDSTVYEFQVEQILPVEGIMICAIGRTLRETYARQSGTSTKEFTPLVFEQKAKVGDAAFVYGKMENGMDFLKDFMVNKISVNPQQHLSKDIEIGNPGICMSMLTSSIPYSLFGSPVISSNGKILGLLHPCDPNDLEGQSLINPGWFLGPIVDQYRAKKEIKRPFLGLTVTKSENYGAFVTRVVANSPAERAGLKMGDTIIGIDGTRVLSSHDFFKLIGFQENKKLKLEILRNDKFNTAELSI